MSYIPKDAVTQSFRSNKGVLTPNQIIELDNENKFTKFGQLELIETQTITPSVSTVDFTTIKQDIYNVHFLTCNNVQAISDGPTLRIQFYENGVLETGSVYDYAVQYGNGVGSFGELKASTASNILFGSNIGGSTSESGQGFVYFYNLGDSTKYSYTTMHTISLNADPNALFYYGSSVMPQESKVDGIRLFLDSGNIDTGTFSLYGIRSF